MVVKIPESKGAVKCVDGQAIRNRGREAGKPLRRWSKHVRTRAGRTYRKEQGTQARSKSILPFLGVTVGEKRAGRQTNLENDTE